MKSFYKKFMLFIWFFGCSATLLYCMKQPNHVEEKSMKFSQGLHRDLILLINADEHYSDLGTCDSILMNLFTAIIQQQAPIIVNHALWERFCNMRKSFYENSDKDLWINVYQQLNETLQNLINTYNTDPKLIAEHFNEACLSNQNLDEAISTLDGYLLSPTEEQINALMSQFACYLIPFDISTWDIYTYSNELYLLIPHKYKNIVLKEYDEATYNLYGESINFNIYGEHQDLIKLGFNPTLRKLTVEDQFVLAVQRPWDDTIKEKIPLDRILLTHSSFEQHELPCDVYPYQWNIFWAGHGSNNIANDDLVQLDLLNQKIQRHWQEIETHLETMQLKIVHDNHDLDTKIKKINALIQSIESNYFNGIKKLEDNLSKQIDLGKITEDQALPLYTEGMNQLEKQRNESQQKLAPITSLLIQIFEIRDEINLILNKINISGVNAPCFKETLQFFNNEVSTSFLEYTTCFGGGRNYWSLYTSLFGQQDLRFNYTISSITIDEHTTSTANLYIGSFDHIINNFFKLKDFNNSVNLMSEMTIKKYMALGVFFIPKVPCYLDFNTFFGSLHNPQSTLMQIATSVYTPVIQIESDELSELYSRIENMPVIRLPGSSRFYVYDIDQRITKITKTTLKTKTINDVMTINGNKKSGILLYTYHVPVTLHLQNRLPLSIIPAQYKPNLENFMSGYYFNTIIAPPNIGCNDIIKLLLQQTDLNSWKQRKNATLFIIDEIKNGNDLNFNTVFCFNNFCLKSMPEPLQKLFSPDLLEQSVSGAIYKFGGWTWANVYLKDGSHKALDIDNYPGAIQAYELMYNYYKQKLHEKAKQDNLIEDDQETDS